MNFEKTREAFDLPSDLIYLDGNSLGPLPRIARQRMAEEVDEHWGRMLIRAWNDAGWMDLPSTTGNRIARIVGAPEGSVIVCDSTSVNLYKALMAAMTLNARPGRNVVLSDDGNFPTDLYVAEGVCRSLGAEAALRLVAHEAIADAIGEDVAVLMLTEVDYRTGRRHDMKALTNKAQAAGAVVIWDLAHSAGAFEVDLEGSKAEFAVGCGYKYLNGGPGAPAFIYVRPDLVEQVQPAMSAWMGHAAPFDFDTGYRPAAGIERMRVGTPPVLSLACLDAALTLWEDIDLKDVRAQSMTLTDRFIAEVESRCPELTLASPRDGMLRGSQVSFRHNEGFAIMQALIDEGVVGDFRAPDILRFGFAPLYVREDDVVAAAAILENIMQNRIYDQPKFRVRGKVT